MSWAKYQGNHEITDQGQAFMHLNREPKSVVPGAGLETLFLESELSLIRIGLEKAREVTEELQQKAVGNFNSAT